MHENRLLEDKVILVTGATTGIGESVARLAVAEGASVMVHGRSEQRARKVSEDLGDRAEFVIGDLGDPSVPPKVVDAVVSRFGRIDGIVNNAALTTRSDLESTSADVFDRIINVNLRAPLLTIRAAMPYFRKQGGGVVLNVGSINALGGEPNLLAYSISKAGLVTMTRNLSAAHALERIRVNHINVGWTLTENERKLKEEEGLGPGWEEQLPPELAPAGRLFLPDEVAAHVVFWMSDAAGPVSGAVYELEQYPMIGWNPSKG
jgi:NAD(P)-dependent dehydrogenase (short-subunit alcohol dehydrogenase family)